MYVQNPAGALALFHGNLFVRVCGDLFLPLQRVQVSSLQQMHQLAKVLHSAFWEQALLCEGMVPQ